VPSSTWLASLCAPRRRLFVRATLCGNAEQSACGPVKTWGPNKVIKKLHATFLPLSYFQLATFLGGLCVLARLFPQVSDTAKPTMTISDQLWVTHKDAMNTQTFIGNAIVGCIINFGINFGFGWAAVSKWGKLQQDNFEEMYVWTLTPGTNSCIALDMALTCLFMGWFTILFGSNGIVQDIKDGKTRPVDTEVTKHRFWQWTPVRVEGLCFRGLLLGLQVALVLGMPTVLLVFASVGYGGFPGVGYAAFKGVWAFFAAFPIFCVMFFSASDSRNYVRAQYEALNDSGSVSQVPLVGSVSRV